ncbi:hypothetical protein HKBW3S09_00082 [Candidatus Hakubella thermalkaliphila]|uniref:Uncharacterized protein n=2 Tax=Candidatus Hakubella thermalkaliphila TaxID=2754717 RepID=A0A6V8NTA7_9ACTN|nr:hypothetical protein HKBW3S09_00082 [Candidatus Hakubella thermalkaliphila]GFP30432.1 hypothetical protein HKBW3S34_01353 [Candidatus Hakubella thermalkaliphila]GFP42184.1 hypothetical protein HKBW3C_01310 [Candidatus Hakubella thermalkaliphila]
MVSQMNNHNRKDRICLYDEPRVEVFRVEEIAAALQRWLPSFPVELRDDFFAFHLRQLSAEAREQSLDSLARALAEARVRDPFSPPPSPREIPNPDPLPGEIDYERRRLTESSHRAFGILYDGYELLSIMRELIPAEETGLRTLHLAFTNQLLGTWDDTDGHYHARVGIFGHPALISIPGLVEAPARPRSYYLLRQQYQALGFPEAEEAALATATPGEEPRWLEHDDPRLTEALKGYALQAALYVLTGEAFCPELNCCLYNAHWQEELIRAQLSPSPALCPRHQRVLERLATAPEWERW